MVKSMERHVTSAGRGPLVIRGSLTDWECEFRARLAVTEEERELAQMRAEMAKPLNELAQAQAEAAQLRGEIARLQGEVKQLQGTLQTVEKMLRGLQSSRGYQMFRLLGRWDSLEQGIRRTFR
jgi:septal ring factor EnvC (AmiA/AmiB activator)